jgi:glycosidase
MAVILDWVANHTAYDHEWTKNKSWYLQDSVGNIISPPGMGWNDVAQLNFNNLEMRSEMIRSMKNWVLSANIDGFRCDYSDGPPLDFWKQALDTLRNIKSHKLLMLAEGSRNGNFSVGFDYNFGFGFFGTMKRIFERGRSVTLVDSINKMDYTGALENQMMVRYTSNHDVNGSDGTPQELFGGEKGAMAAFIIASYMKSIPMIYNGQEVGTPFRLLFPFTTAKIDWTLNPGITAEYKKILAFRNQSMAIRRGALESFTNDDVCAFIKTFGNEKVLVLANLRDKIVSFKIPSTLKNDKWQDAFNGKSIKLKQTTHLDPYTYIVLRTK